MIALRQESALIARVVPGRACARPGVISALAWRQDALGLRGADFLLAEGAIGILVRIQERIH